MTTLLNVRNSGFDGPFVAQGGNTHLMVASGWKVLWKDGPNARHGFLVRPECYPKELRDIQGNLVDICQGIQSTNATHRAAFVQALALPPDARAITVEARVAYHAISGGMAARVGIDPTGQLTNLHAETIQWGRWLNQDGDPAWVMGEWTVGKATLDKSRTYGGYISIWLLSENKWRGKNNHVFWRDVFAYMGDQDPDPEPDTAAALIMEAIELLLEAVGKL